SEEHTSELQSHLNLVCRLLLEKKTGYLSGTKRQTPVSARNSVTDTPRLEALIAGVMNAGTLHDGFIKDDHGTQIIGTDQNPGSFGYPLAMFGASGGQNALVGEVTNDLATPNFSFPTGITGYGKEASGGNHAFGVYGLGEL